MRKRLSILAAFVAAVPLVVSAQTVWRCGNSYSQQPCAGGTAVDASSAVTAGDAGKARSVGLSDAERAQALEKARVAQEKNAPKAVVIGPPMPAPAPEAVASKDGTKPKMGKLEQFTATGPRPPKEKKPAKKKPEARKGNAGIP